MWRTIRYVIKARGYGSVVISLFLFGGAAWLAQTDTNAGGFSGFVKYLAISSAFLASVLVASACKPENIPVLEVYNTVPYPFWLTTLQYVTVDLLGIVLMAILVTVVTLMLGDNAYHSKLALLGVVNVISNSILFGGFALLGTVVGRDSRIGQLVGLIVFIFSLVMPLPESIHPALYFYKVAEGLAFPNVWWALRIGYSILGIMTYILALSLVRDVDRLIVGKQSRSRLLFAANAKPGGKWSKRGVLSRPLPVAGSKSLGVALYEALLVILDGRIPILLATAYIVFVFGASLLEVLHGGLAIGIRSLATSPGSLAYFLLPFLPMVLTDRIPHDRRNLLDQTLLTALAPREYLTAKAGGVGIAVIGLFLLLDIPVLFITALGTLIDIPYLMYHLGILALGVLPALIYISVLGVLIGALARMRHSILLGGIMAVGYMALLVVTQNSVVGNILFPTGVMATRTFEATLARLVGMMTLESSQMAVPLYVLFLPLLSVTFQIGLAWFFIGRYFEKEVTEAS